jgi:pSer/pThr/pTyr-binding forkhead associated (FHA) protein
MAGVPALQNVNRSPGEAGMLRITFRHISGSRATQVDVVRLGAHRELILGRALSAAVRFDPHDDASVGRQHARITPMTGDPGHLMLCDLGSRNGTLLNGHRVDVAVPIRSGDVVRLGAAGPEVEVVIEATA